ncbi:MAG: glycosyltransferase family 87 protein, partial [Mucinivorans sp.]
MMPLQKYFTLRNVIILGLVVAFGVTFSEVLRGAHRNFMIFSFSTRDFWSGISPYGQQWWRHGLDYYLYAPTFNVLFAPFAFLPQWLGAFVWNLFNYSLFALSVYYLPRLSELNKCRLLLYSLPILATAQLSFQYNVAIAYIFLFAFTLLEKGYYKWAILLIMTSALTKVYGGFELALLLFYPRLWRNLGWAVLWGAVLFLLPLLRLGGSEFLPYYSQWIGALSSHEDTRVFESFFDTHFLFSQGHPSYTPYVQIGLFMVLAILSLLRHKLWNVYLFR